MAFKLAYKEYPEAYWKIQIVALCINGYKTETENDVEARFNIYKNQASRDANEDPIGFEIISLRRENFETESFVFNSDTTNKDNIITKAYVEAKTRTGEHVDFSEAIDC